MTQPAGRPLSAEFDKPGDKPGGKPGGPPKPGDKPGGLKAAFKKNPAVVIGTAGVGAVIVFALAKKNSAANSTNNGYSDTSTNPGAALPVYDSSASDMYNNLETQLGNLQDQIAGLGQTPTTPTTPTPTTGGGSTSSLPGPIHGERTRAGAETLPQLAHLFGISPQTLVAYNPGWSLSQTKTFDPHNIGSGVFFRVPSTARQKTLHPGK